MFFIFIKMCKKYKFTYAISVVNGLSIMLYPNDALGFIEVRQAYYDRSYLKLFLKAIKKMKAYREGSEHL